MYIGLHRQKQAGKTYTSVLHCESFRDSEKGGAPRSRVLINLGPSINHPRTEYLMTRTDSSNLAP